MSLLARNGKIKGNIEGAGRQAANARSVARTIDDAMNESVRNVADDAELIYQSAAPRRSHRLARGIKARVVGDQAVVSATAVDPESGFDYVNVTRFGHRKRVIYPVTKAGKPRKARKATRGAGGQFSARGGGALAFQSLGRQWILSSVRGFRPKGDWVELALPEVTAAADTELDRTGNEIAVKWSS